jgi:hypothetical protein
MGHLKFQAGMTHRVIEIRPFFSISRASPCSLETNCVEARKVYTRIFRLFHVSIMIDDGVSPKFNSIETIFLDQPQT